MFIERRQEELMPPQRYSALTNVLLKEGRKNSQTFYTKGHGTSTWSTFSPLLFQRGDSQTRSIPLGLSLSMVCILPKKAFEAKKKITLEESKNPRSFCVESYFLLCGWGTLSVLSFARLSFHKFTK